MKPYIPVNLWTFRNSWLQIWRQQISHKIWYLYTNLREVRAWNLTTYYLSTDCDYVKLTDIRKKEKFSKNYVISDYHSGAAKDQKFSGFDDKSAIKYLPKARRKILTIKIKTIRCFKTSENPASPTIAFQKAWSFSER